MQPSTGSDPLYWRRLLELEPFADLRLCLGHAAGAAEWCGPELGPYARTVVELCSLFDNVYCEFGHFEEIIEPERMAAFTENLARLVLDSTGAPSQCGEKIMFGSDWHVAAALNGRMFEDMEAFVAAFENDLAPLADGFFATSALRYLGDMGEGEHQAWNCPNGVPASRSCLSRPR